MPSPFLQRPASEWVASNDLAFAIRDGFPVRPGHTLVVPKREVATWFDASREELIAASAIKVVPAPRAQNLPLSVVPAVPLGDVREVAALISQPPRPDLHILPCGQVGLPRPVARGVGEDEVLDGVHGDTDPRNEVGDLWLAEQSLPVACGPAEGRNEWRQASARFSRSDSADAFLDSPPG